MMPGLSRNIGALPPFAFSPVVLTPSRALTLSSYPLPPSQASLPNAFAALVGVFLHRVGEEDVTSGQYGNTDHAEAVRGVREALGGWESCNIGSRLLLTRQSRADIA